MAEHDALCACAGVAERIARAIEDGVDGWLAAPDMDPTMAMQAAYRDAARIAREVGDG